ncbi:MAG: extracellular solute-binding protein [Acidobacteria bacterium]|nr:extracellular solute-binding protein [Acidobacteriota bacterium]
MDGHKPGKGVSRRTFLRTSAATLSGAAATWLLASCGAPATVSEAPASQTAAASTAPTTASTEPTAAPTVEPTPAPTVGAINTGAKINLRFWHMDYAPHNQSFDALAKAFQKEFPDIGITREPQPQAEHVAKYQQGFVSGTQPDLIAIHGGAAALFVQSGVLAPLDGAAFQSGEMEKLFFPALLEAYQANGHIYGVPLANNTPGIGFIINLDHFEEAKVDIPEQFASWDAVWETAQKLTKKDGSGKIIRAGMNVREGHQLQYVCGMMLEQGAQYFDPASGKFSFNSDAGHAAIKVLTDAVAKLKVDSPDIPPAFDSLANGLSSMGMIWIDYIPYAKSQFPDKHYGFIVRPPYAGKDLLVSSEGPWGVQVTAASKQQQAAMEFMKFLAREENLRAWYQQQNALPSSPALVNDPYFKSNDSRWVRKALETMPGWRNEGPFPIWKMNSDISWPILEKAILGSQTVESAAKQIDDEGTAMVAEFRSQVQDLKS